MRNKNLIESKIELGKKAIEKLLEDRERALMSDDMSKFESLYYCIFTERERVLELEKELEQVIIIQEQERAIEKALEQARKNTRAFSYTLDYYARARDITSSREKAIYSKLVERATRKLKRARMQEQALLLELKKKQQKHNCCNNNIYKSIDSSIFGVDIGKQAICLECYIEYANI